MPQSIRKIMVSHIRGCHVLQNKTSGSRSYLQIVENRWEGGRSRQRVVATLGRLDQLQQDGSLDALLLSGARFAQSVLVLSAHARGEIPTITTQRIGPALIFERLWQQTGCQHVIKQLLKGRRYEFDLETRDLPSPSSIASSIPAATEPPTSGRRTTKSQDVANSSFITSTAPWPGSVRCCR